MICCLADTHLGHELIAHTRHFKVGKEHDEAVLDGINSVAKKRDRLYIVGDFCKDNAHKWRQRIVCKEVTLIRGNHDCPSICRAFGKGHLFDTRMVKVRSGINLFMSHYPHCYWPGSHHGSARNKVYVGSIHVYGHVHDEKEAELNRIWPDRRSQDVGVDTAIRLLGSPKPFDEAYLLEHLWAGRKGHHEIGTPWEVPKADLSAADRYGDRSDTGEQNQSGGLPPNAATQGGGPV